MQFKETNNHKFAYHLSTLRLGFLSFMHHLLMHIPRIRCTTLMTILIHFQEQYKQIKSLGSQLSVNPTDQDLFQQSQISRNLSKPIRNLTTLFECNLITSTASIHEIIYKTSRKIWRTSQCKNLHKTQPYKEWNLITITTLKMIRA